MFSQFFASLQQDAKLFLFFPILCALFRAIFIKVYSPYPNFAGKERFSGTPFVTVFGGAWTLTPMFS